MKERPLYRPFALVAFATTLGVGTPLGIRMLAWLYGGAAAVRAEWVELHAHLQLFGFFAMLIPGVAPHLFARFTGREVPAHPAYRWIFGLLTAALLLRLAGTWRESPASLLLAAGLQSCGFVLFAWRVWRALDAPPLALLRRHLTISTGWLALACIFEALLRWRALPVDTLVPDIGALRAVHAMALYGGVIGWVLGVLLRPSPMFVATWRVPVLAAGVAPWLLGVGVVMAAAGVMRHATLVARLGESICLALSIAIPLSSGTARRVRGLLPIVSRGPEETRIFRLALVSIGTALIGSLIAISPALVGAADLLLVDTVRHLVTVGFLTGVVVAMTFHLIPVLEARPLPWPKLRRVAFWALLLGVVFRTAEVLAGFGWRGVSPLIIASGFCVWIALACVAMNLAAVVVLLRPTEVAQ